MMYGRFVQGRPKRRTERPSRLSGHAGSRETELLCLDVLNTGRAALLTFRTTKEAYAYVSFLHSVKERLDPRGLLDVSVRGRNVRIRKRLKL